jgi:predicted TPR repeat methyltransferase
MNEKPYQMDKVENFFSAFADKWDSLYGGKRNFLLRIFDNIFRRDIWERYEVTFNILGNDFTDKTILDIGCGSGLYCIEAARRGAKKIVGIDCAEDMLKIARKNINESGYQDKCEFIYGKFPGDVKEGNFNFTIIMGVMDYVENPLDFLKVARYTTSEISLISFPGKHWFRAPLRKYRYKIMGRCNVYTYDEPLIRALCKDAGYSKIDINFIRHSGTCYIVTAYC